MDIDYFWKLVNRQKKRSRVLHPLKMKDGEILTDPASICEAWKEYFSKLYLPDENTHNNDFQSYIEQKMKEIGC